MHRTLLLARCTAAAAVLMVAATAQAQAPAAGVHRCGNTYSSTPCPGGQAVQADDPRSDAQRQQALAVKQQDAQLARELAAERQAREKAVAGQRAVRIGPSEADRLKAEKLATKKKEKPPAKKKRKTTQAKRGPA